MAASPRRAASAFLFLGATLLACVAPVPLYEGPPRPREAVALLSAPGPATILEVDGRAVDRLESDFTLAPGLHVIVFRVRRTHQNFGVAASTEMGTAAPQFVTHCVVSAELRAGHRYEVRSKLVGAKEVHDPSTSWLFRVDHRTLVTTSLADETTGEELGGLRCHFAGSGRAGR